MTKRKLVAAATAMVATFTFAAGSVSAKGGANNDGPYYNDCQIDNSCVPSQNGNGNGNANGRPAAGSVGNADKKNPPGQVRKLEGDLVYPANDGDSGYECDSNNGIGKGNPAHSPCVPADDGDDDNVVV
jgi:hypothetical protein